MTALFVLAVIPSHLLFPYLCKLAGYPLRGNYQCVCDLYEIRIIILIIIIISLGQILLSYIANTSCTHARAHKHTHTHTHTHCHRRSGYCCSMGRRRQIVTELTPPFSLFRYRSMAGSCFIQIDTRAGGTVSRRFWVFFAYKKISRPN